MLFMQEMVMTMTDTDSGLNSQGEEAQAATSEVEEVTVAVVEEMVAEVADLQQDDPNTEFS